MNNKNNFIPSLSIIAGAVLWGFIGIFLKKLTELSSAELMIIRCSITAVLLFVFILIKDASLIKVKLGDIKYFIGTGIISFFSYSFAYFSAIRLTSMSVAAILLYTSPIFVTIISIFVFKEKLTRKKLVAVVLAFLGCVLITGLGGGVQIGMKGLAAGLLSGICYALYSIFGKLALKKYSSLTVTAYTFLFASLATVPFVNFGSMSANITSESLPLLITFAFTSGLIPYVLYTYGLSRTSAGKAAVMACVEPVTAALAGIFIMNEEASVSGIIGIILVLAAVVVLQIKEEE